MYEYVVGKIKKHMARSQDDHQNTTKKTFFDRGCTMYVYVYIDMIVCVGWFGWPERVGLEQIKFRVAMM